MARYHLNSKQFDEASTYARKATEYTEVFFMIYLFFFFLPLILIINKVVIIFIIITPSQDTFGAYFGATLTMYDVKD